MLPLHTMCVNTATRPREANCCHNSGKAYTTISKLFEVCHVTERKIFHEWKTELSILKLSAYYITERNFSHESINHPRRKDGSSLHKAWRNRNMPNSSNSDSYQKLTCFNTNLEYLNSICHVKTTSLSSKLQQFIFLFSLDYLFMNPSFACRWIIKIA